MKASAHERQALTNLLTRMRKKKKKKATYTPKNTLWFTASLPRIQQRNRNRVYFNTPPQSCFSIAACTEAGRLPAAPAHPRCGGTKAQPHHLRPPWGGLGPAATKIPRWDEDELPNRKLKSVCLHLSAGPAGRKRGMAGVDMIICLPSTSISLPVPSALLSCLLTPPHWTSVISTPPPKQFLMKGSCIQVFQLWTWHKHIK